MEIHQSYVPTTIYQHLRLKLPSELDCAENIESIPLKYTENNNGDITGWLSWFLNCLYRALKSTEESIYKVLHKAEFWDKHKETAINGRQFSIF